MAVADIRAIMRILPHRYPMLLLDRITELEPMVLAHGFKNVTANEPMLVGHFPGNPVFPGVYMIEALAQLGGAMVLEPGDLARKLVYIVGIDKVKFRRPVIPGDRLDMEAKMLRVRRNIGWVEVAAKVGGALACSGELMFSIGGDPASYAYDATILRQ
jgi:beta-hydroxyacyl-ACP dehydratase FabZ